MVVLDQDLGEDVDGGQGAERHGALTRPHQVDPEHAGQVGGAHPVNDALLGHLGEEGALAGDSFCFL